MEQVPAEFEGARICYFDRKANVGQNVFKSISCPEKLRAHLNGNDWDYDFRTKRRLQLKNEIIGFTFYGLKSQCHPKKSLKF